MGAGEKLFANHPRTWRENRYVYPVVSRRSRGVSIGVNLNPGKACNFGCVYCCVNRTTPATVRRVDLHVLASELDEMLGIALSGALFHEPPFHSAPQALRRVNDVAFSGDGEPTSYARFGDACRLVAEALERHGVAGGVKIVVITNATLLHRPAVRQALEYLDGHNGQVWAKLDAGTEAYFKAVDVTKVSFGRVLANIRDAGRVRPVVIQSMFVSMNGTGPSETEVNAYVGRLKWLREEGCRVGRVQAYTVARPVAVEGVGALTNGEVDRIVGRVRDAGFEADGFYDAGEGTS